MISFQVDDMSCGHCVASITKAVQTVDAGARVQVDLATHRVAITPGRASAAELGDAIRGAGFNPVAVDGAVGAQAGPR